MPVCLEEGQRLYCHCNLTQKQMTTADCFVPRMSAIVFLYERNDSLPDDMFRMKWLFHFDQSQLQVSNCLAVVVRFLQVVTSWY